MKGRLKTELAPKSWTLIKAYSGALCKLGSVCDRTQLFQFQTATLPVVVIHIVIYLLHQFIYRQFTCVIETLRLQHRKEAFHRRIVPTVRLSRHALNHGMLRKQFPIPRRTVQHTLVRMKHRSFISQTGCGFFEHFLHHFAVGSAAHGVGDDLAVEQVQDWREVQFAVLPFEFGNVGQPFFVGLSGFEPAFEEVFRYFAHSGMAVGFFRPYEGFQFQLLHQPRHFFAVPTQCCGNAPLPVASFMPPVGFDKEGFVGCVGIGSVLVMVVKAAFGQVCDVQQVFERVLRPQCLDGLALSFAVCFWLRAFNSFR